MVEHATENRGVLSSSLRLGINGDVAWKRRLFFAQMFKPYKNSKKRGDAGLGIAIAWFTAAGYTVCIPLTDSQDYDLVIDRNGLHRVQVTTCSQKQPSGNYVVELRTVSYGGKDYNIKHFESKAIDYLFVITDVGEKYLIPSNVLSDYRRSVTLSADYDQYKVG